MDTRTAKVFEALITNLVEAVCLAHLSGFRELGDQLSLVVQKEKTKHQSALDALHH